MSAEFEGQIRQVVRHYLQQQRSLTAGGVGTQTGAGRKSMHVKLTTAIHKATHHNTGPYTGTADIMTMDENGVLTVTTKSINVRNRSTSRSGIIDEQVIVDYIDGEWLIRWPDIRVQAITTSDIFAAVNTKRDPSTGTARILHKKADGDLTLSTETVTIVNRFMHISVDSGTTVKLEWIDGEWQMYAADCSPGGSSSGSV